MAKSGHIQLIFKKRAQIAVWNLEGVGKSEMACRLGRSQLAVSRELSCSSPAVRRFSIFTKGANLARREHKALLAQDERLEYFVVERLTEGWTPEQIAGRLKRGEKKGLRGLGAETIYCYIHRAPAGCAIHP